ncbi:unnamed protein product [Leptosia nina]|uniref:Uncharacterized protein n=1 Tax=Leptosia nina TaxID=320188 RepID=A0AAV1K1L0_9NEOP
MLTRRGFAAQEEAKLKLALKELQSLKDLCAQLTLEREENERELLESKKNLKSELTSLFQENTKIQHERDTRPT